MFYNTKIIDYGDYLHIEFFDKAIRRNETGEDIDEIKEKLKNEEKKKEIIEDNDKQDQEHSNKVSVNRSKNNLFRIARSNEWDLFITLTFDRKQVDSSDYKEVSKLVTRFLDKLRRYNPCMKYLIVPELHKDKTHYHFHGLLYNANLDLINSGKVDKDGEVIYNVNDWTWGFSTAMRIKSQSAVRNYIGKYITKELMNKLKYKKRYYASQNVNVCDEELSMMKIDEIYDLYGDNLSYIKTIDVNGYNRIKYLEIKKD